MLDAFIPLYSNSLYTEKPSEKGGVFRVKQEPQEI